MPPSVSADAWRHLALFCWFYGYTPDQFRSLTRRDYETLRDFMLSKLKADGFELEEDTDFDALGEEPAGWLEKAH